LRQFAYFIVLIISCQVGKRTELVFPSSRHCENPAKLETKQSGLKLDCHAHYIRSQWHWNWRPPTLDDM